MAASASPNFRYVAYCRKSNESLRDADVVLTRDRGLHIVTFLTDGKNDMHHSQVTNCMTLRTIEIHFVLHGGAYLFSDDAPGRVTDLAGPE